jgi:hypothetical protein
LSDNTKLDIDASGNFTIIGGTSQWTIAGTSIFYTSNFVVNTTNLVLRITSNSIDCVATDGSARFPLSFGGGASTFNANGRSELNKVLQVSSVSSKSISSIFYTIRNFIS